ncbi:MAG: diaminopimelate epimerase [Lachnospiraceae bacterium]|nr:diaminopimelate epimerase [Lachnospiraceae bacterium]
MSILLSKYHGLGNDYLILDPNKNDIKLQDRKIEMICRRNFGVGSDGILYGPIFDEGKIYLKIFNPDGSEAEKSGNGVRIFAKYLLDESYVDGKPFTLNTKGGEVKVEYLNKRGTRIQVDMGKVSFASHQIPVTGPEREVINEPMMFSEKLYNATCLTIGNPHCVIMMEEATKKTAEKLGPYVEADKRFPNRINMQLLRVIDRKTLQIEIYERGAGYTLASGSSACAAAAAAYRMGFVDSCVTVQMPGGELEIEIGSDDTVTMTGSVGYIGEITLAEDFFS